MITKSTYNRVPAERWIGTKVKLRFDIKTRGGVVFHAGEILTITDKQGGFTLQRENREYIRKVPYYDVELCYEEGINGSI